VKSEERREKSDGGQETGDERKRRVKSEERREKREK
jgi:hypothetical protein